MSNDTKFQRLEPCMQESFFSNISMEGHDRFLNDLPTTLLEKADPFDPVCRKHYREKTLETMILNI